MVERYPGRYYTSVLFIDIHDREDLRFLGNFESVESIFSDVVREKEEILQKKARGFVPDATEELKDCLNRFKNKAEERINLLSGSDRDALVGQKKAVEIKIDEIKSDIAEVFGDITIKLETEKAKAVRELREYSNSVQIKERTGSKTHHGSYTTGHLWWKKTEHYSYVTHYSYFLASDAIEKLCQFSNEACNRVEEVFSESLQLKSIKSKLSAVVGKHFIEQNENYDTALFRIIVEDVISSIEFPVFKLDISSSVDRISGKFSGELTSASDKTKLSNEVTKATAEVYSEICNSLANRVKEYKTELKNIGLRIQDTLLNEVNEEFEELMRKCKNRDEEIESYKTYASILENEIAKLSN